MAKRDRDESGRPRSARPRDSLGRPLARDSAGIPPVPDDLELAPGAHIKAVADMLGHSSIAVTGDIYGHTSDDTARAAVDGCSGVLGL